MNFFISSGKVTHIFSENSFTLIESVITISTFLISVPDVAASFFTAGVLAFVGSGFLPLNVLGFKAHLENDGVFGENL